MLPTEDFTSASVFGAPQGTHHHIAKVIQLLSHRDYVLSFLNQNCEVQTFVFSLLGVRVFIRLNSRTTLLLTSKRPYAGQVLT